MVVCKSFQPLVRGSHIYELCLVIPFAFPFLTPLHGFRPLSWHHRRAKMLDYLHSKPGSDSDCAEFRRRLVHLGTYLASDVLCVPRQEAAIDAKDCSAK